MAASAGLKLVGKLTVTLVEARDLRDVVVVGQMDPFARVELGGEKFTTKVHKKGGKKPVWNQAFVFNLEGKAVDRLHIVVNAKGLISDTAIGRTDIPVESVLKATELTFFQLVSTVDFNKITGQIGILASYVGSGAPPQPAAGSPPSAARASFSAYTPGAAASSAAAPVTPVPVAGAAPAAVAVAVPAASSSASAVMPVAMPIPANGAPTAGAAPAAFYGGALAGTQIVYQPTAGAYAPPYAPHSQPVWHNAGAAAGAYGAGGYGQAYAPYVQQVVYTKPAAAMAMSMPSNKCTATNKQAGWRWCSRCQVLWFALYNNSTGVCAAGGGHAYQGSGHYHAPLVSGAQCNGQSGWKWCCRCMGLFYGAAVSVCPAGGAHDGSGSGDYTMCMGAAHGQNGWGWCSRCGAFWYTNNRLSSYCPAGGNHNNQGSGNYQLGHD